MIADSLVFQMENLRVSLKMKREAYIHNRQSLWQFAAKAGQAGTLCVSVRVCVYMRVSSVKIFYIPEGWCDWIGIIVCADWAVKAVS